MWCVRAASLVLSRSVICPASLEEASMPKITPNLWFDTEAEEAADFYTSVFANSRVVGVTHYTEAGPRPAGTVMTVEFELDGQRFVGINGGSSSASTRPSPSRSTARHRTRSTTSGRSSPTAVRKGPCGWLQGPLRSLLAGRADRDGGAVRRSGPERGPSAR